MPYTIGTMLPPNLSPVTFQLATRADPTNFLATVYTATPRASLTTQYEFSVSVTAGDYLVKQLQAPYASGYVRLSGTSDVLHFDSLDDLIRHEMQTAEHDATQSAISALGANVTVTSYSPVAASGQLDQDIIIGDDYLAANSRAFVWDVPPIVGVDHSTATCKFGGTNGTDSWLVNGALSVDGDAWVLTFDMPRSVTEQLEPGYYSWSVKVYSASGTEVTRVQSKKHTVQVVQGHA